MGDFGARMAELQERVGDGTLEGKVVVDQHYAYEQHQRTDIPHPRGGGPFYLLNPLMENGNNYVQNLANAVLDGESALIGVMAENMEHLQSLLDPAAPIDREPNDIRLRRSGNPRVYDNGAEAYNRQSVDPPEVPGEQPYRSRRDSIWDDKR